MSATVLYMSMSLDGFVTGPDVGPQHGLGVGGERLHEWVLTGDPDTGLEAALGAAGPVNRSVIDEFMSTGAVIAGRATFEPAHGWNGDHHDGVPIFILSRHPAPEWASGWANVHYVDDLAAATREAKAAAGDRDVLVHGSSIAQRALAIGALDELELHVVPVLLGEGTRLFEHLGREHRELERTRVLEGENGVTHLHYRVRHAG